MVRQVKLDIRQNPVERPEPMDELLRMEIRPEERLDCIAADKRRQPDTKVVVVVAVAGGKLERLERTDAE